MRIEQPPVLLGGILDPAIGVEDAARPRPAQGDGALQRRPGQTGIDPAADGVADDAARPGIEHDREIDEAGRDRC